MKQFVCLIALFFLVFISYFFGFSMGKQYEKYEFLRVVDGDTLAVNNLRDDSENRVRLLGLNAPEISECGGEHSKKFLDELVTTKGIEFKKVGVDSFGRVVAKIVVDKVDIAPEILRNGMAKVDDASKDHIKADSKPTAEYLDVLRKAESEAKNAELGIWSKKCVAEEPKRDPSCVIKGNYRDGKKVYYLPSCSQYKNVVVEEQAGDKWLCSESEAKTLGFYLAGSCKK